MTIEMTDSDIDRLIDAYATIDGDVARMRDGVAALHRDHTRTPAATLTAWARGMLPRCSIHIAPHYVVDLLDSTPTCDPFLAGALVRSVWTAGKAGFPMLPDPRWTRRSVYRARRDDLAGWLTAHQRRHRQGARRLLHGADLAFFDALPAAVTIYRGAAGIDAALAAAGPCWTTDPARARWFAKRAADFGAGRPVVVAARVTVERDALTAFAQEAEIVALPRTFWTIVL